MPKKLITISEKQLKFINGNYIKLSSFVQDKLDELMQEYEKNGRTKTTTG